MKNRPRAPNICTIACAYVMLISLTYLSQPVSCSTIYLNTTSASTLCTDSSLGCSFLNPLIWENATTPTTLDDVLIYYGGSVPTLFINISVQDIPTGALSLRSLQLEGTSVSLYIGNVNISLNQTLRVNGSKVLVEQSNLSASILLDHAEFHVSNKEVYTRRFQSQSSILFVPFKRGCLAVDEFAFSNDSILNVVFTADNISASDAAALVIWGYDASDKVCTDWKNTSGGQLDIPISAIPFTTGSDVTIVNVSLVGYRLVAQGFLTVTYFPLSPTAPSTPAPTLTPTPPPKKGETRNILWITIAVAGVIAICIIVVIAVSVFRKKIRSYFVMEDKMDHDHAPPHEDGEL